jgi:hypothetical protein
MARLFLILFRIAVFVAIFALTTGPSWQLIEKRWTQDFSTQREIPTRLFAVLVRQPDRGNRFAVDHYPGIGPQSKLVTDFADHDLDDINRDLRASISAERSRYVYFKVLGRGPGYVDVSLEQPTTGDYWRKNSYRIQNGEVHPQRITFFGPVFGIVVAILPTIAGLLAALSCELVVRRCRRRIVEVQAALQKKSTF